MPVAVVVCRRVPLPNIPQDGVRCNPNRLPASAGMIYLEVYLLLGLCCSNNTSLGISFWGLLSPFVTSR